MAVRRARDEDDNDDERQEEEDVRDAYVTSWLVCCVRRLLYIGGAPNYKDVAYLTGPDVRVGVFVNLRPLSGAVSNVRGVPEGAPRELAYAASANSATREWRMLHRPLGAFEPQGRLKEEQNQSVARHYAHHALRIYKDVIATRADGQAVYVHKDNGRGEEVYM